MAVRAVLYGGPHDGEIIEAVDGEDVVTRIHVCFEKVGDNHKGTPVRSEVNYHRRELQPEIFDYEMIALGPHD